MAQANTPGTLETEREVAYRTRDRIIQGRKEEHCAHLLPIERKVERDTRLVSETHSSLKVRKYRERWITRHGEPSQVLASITFALAPPALTGRDSALVFEGREDPFQEGNVLLR